MIQADWLVFVLRKKTKQTSSTECTWKRQNKTILIYTYISILGKKKKKTNLYIPSAPVIPCEARCTRYPFDPSSNRATVGAMPEAPVVGPWGAMVGPDGATEAAWKDVEEMMQRGR